MNLIGNILADIARRESQRLQHEDRLSIGLLAGDLGSVMFLYEYSRLDSQYQSIADNLLDKLLSNLRYSIPIQTYCNGLAGTVIGMYAMRNEGFVDDFSPLLAQIDVYLQSSLHNMLQSNNHDFLHGFIGLGFYWLYRYYSGCSTAIEALVSIIEHLKESCEHDGKCIKWRLPESRWRKAYNISLSHGCSSTIVLLCQMLEIPELKHRYGTELEQMISGAVNYIMANRVDEAQLGCWFASSSLECEEPHHGRLAWCYGDLGICIALYHAGKALNDKTLIDFSRRVLEYSGIYRRDLQQNYVNDACLCHGAAGIGLIFREMSKCHSSVILSNTADYWKQAVLQQVVDHQDGLNFTFYDVMSRSYQEKTGILEGSVGVAMYLLNEVAQSSLSEFLLINNNRDSNV